MIAAFKALPGAQKVLWSLGVLLTPLFIVGAVSPTPGMQKIAEIYQTTELPAAPAPEAPVAAIAPEPQILPTEAKTITETIVLPYVSTTQDDPALEADKTVVATRGVNGEKLITYTATYTEGRETSRILISEKITRQPVTEVKKIGTKPKTPPVATPKQSQDVPQCDHHRKHCTPLNNANTCAEEGYSRSGLVFGVVRLLDFTLRLEQTDVQTACE